LPHSERDTEIALIIFNYFTSVQVKWPIAWSELDKEGNILPRSNAFKAFMWYFRLVYVLIVKNEIGQVPKIENFAKFFDRLNVIDNGFTSGNFKPGSGGEVSR